MRAAWDERQGAARAVLTVGELDEPQPLASDMRDEGISLAQGLGCTIGVLRC